MRSFLAPLYFSGRFCRHCARIFYSENPEGWIWQYELEGLPPLGRFVPGEGFVPDYSVLLMFDELVIDGEAVERMKARSAPPWLGDWPEVVDALSAEGALVQIDASAEAKRLSHERGWMLRKEMEEVSRWADPMSYHDALIGEADKALGWEGSDEAHAVEWQFNPENLPGVRGPDGQGHILSSAPLTEPGDDPSDPHHQLHEVAVAQLRQQLREVNAAVAVSTAQDAVPMVWAPYQKYLQVSTDRGPMAEGEHSKAARTFFETAFPHYRPETVKRFAAMRTDHRITQLREHLLEASRAGQLDDPRYPETVLQEVLDIERRVGNMRKIVAWVAGAVGSIPLPGAGAVATLIGEAAASLVERRMKAPKAWFYLASDGTGLS